MTIRSEGAIYTPAPITLGDRTFKFVASLIPERDESGVIKELCPQVRYAKPKGSELHKHGHGPFCMFHITVPKGMIGVYALVVDRCIHSIGACEDLGRLVNTGYGSISPANCFKGGQPTNCKLNQRVLAVSKAGGRVDQYFYPYARPKSDRHTLKKQLISEHLPSWNG